jgi:hypothetical protein
MERSSRARRTVPSAALVICVLRGRDLHLLPGEDRAVVTEAASA